MAQEDENFLRAEEADTLLSEPTQCSIKISGEREHRHHHRVVWLCIVILASMVLNIVLAILLLKARYEIQRQMSPYVGLTFDTVDTISHLGPYGPSNQNETDRAILWENLDGSSAQVAVEKSWAAQKRLPPTQAFSWDRSKAVYSLRGFHAQHCLIRVIFIVGIRSPHMTDRLLQRKIYRWVAISYHNGTQLDHYAHVVHCLDSLLRDIRCYADDTPMISPSKASSSSSIWGQGQRRQCRDWDKLKRWAKMHNACFSYLNETQGVTSMFDRYKWCPPGSPYGANMRSVLGLPDDWNSQPPKDIDSLPAYWEEF